jgi:hypothetical protein
VTTLRRGGDDFSDVVTLVKRIAAMRTQLAGLQLKVGTYTKHKERLVLQVARQQLSTFRHLTALLAQYQVVVATSSPLNKSEGTTGADTDTTSTITNTYASTCDSDWQATAATLTTTADKYHRLYHTSSFSTGTYNNDPNTDTASDSTLNSRHFQHGDFSISTVPTTHTVEKEEDRGRKGDGELTRMGESVGVSCGGSIIVEVSAEDFKQVPPHIRGRSSLTDANHLLRRLQEDHQKQQLKQPLQGQRKKKKKAVAVPVALPGLDAAGYKVCGQTGRCVLGALLKLGLIEWTKGKGQKTETIALSASLCQKIEV